MLALASLSVSYLVSPQLPHAAGASAAARAPCAFMEEGVASLPPTAAQKTWFPKAADTAKSAKSWYVVDADGLRLGRMASECAKILLGKDKATFTPGADVGDAIVIINAEKIIVTGKKRTDKLYRRHSGRPGGMKIESFEELQVRPPPAECLACNKRTGRAHAHVRERVCSSSPPPPAPSRRTPFSPHRPASPSASSRRRLSACSRRMPTAATSSATSRSTRARYAHCTRETRARLAARSTRLEGGAG